MSTRRRPGLSPQAIAVAGRVVIERDGLDRLSMRAVAAELGTGAASLYRHVADREALLVAILEEIATGLPVMVPGETPSERLLTRLVRAHDYMSGHVWVLHVLIRGEMVAEAALAFSDACLADLLEAGLDPARAMAAFRACWHLTIGELLDTHPLTPPREPSQRQQVFARVDPARLPALAGVVAELPPPAERPDTFAESMATLVRGLIG